MSLAPNLKNRSVPTHDFSLNPRPDVPRSAFGMSHALKTAFSFSDLVPILVEEVLPGDTWRCGIHTVARTAIPIVPIQDNWHLEFFTYFIPMRLVWPNAQRFWGEQQSPGDAFRNLTIPQVVSAAGGFPINSIFDYMGLPTVGQVGGGNTVSVNSLPLRCYMTVYNQCFRDENITDWAGPSSWGDGPDAVANFTLKQRQKRYDYITQALPSPQKGATAITLPLGSQAVVKTSASVLVPNAANPAIVFRDATTGGFPSTGAFPVGFGGAATDVLVRSTAPALTAAGSGMYPNNLYADLTTATAATVNQLRQAITLQQYLEKDARGGTRYTEYVYNHFGVRSPDARLQRPEFIGGGHANILTTAIPQTSATGLTGGSTPAGNLSATGHVTGRTGFTYSSTEHGFIITLASARADLTYQQGLRRMWSRLTPYDYPVPLLANLGEQTLYNREVYCDGSAADANAFGYIPRWDEYRHIPSRITGLYRSTSAGTIDYWHSSQKFAALPTLNTTFLNDDSKTVTQRNFSAGASSLNQQLLADFFFDCTVTRALPAYGIPGLTRL